MITFAVIGHNEAATLPHALGQALQAAAKDDVVVFVDSASIDQSWQIAEDAGVEVLEAPLGKGRAIEAALHACRTPFACFIDADIFKSSVNIPLTLASVARTSGPTLVVGQFADATPGILSNTIGVYEPLVATLFPEAKGRFGSRPLSGFRVLDATASWGSLPPDFGVEAHFNITASLMRESRLETTDIGVYHGRFLYKPFMGREIARPILDIAQRLKRLDSAVRPQWDAWVEEVVQHVSTFRGNPRQKDTFARRLRELAQRPLPPTHV